MSPDYLDDNLFVLARCVVLFAIKDYQTMERLSVIRRDRTVNSFFWSRRGHGRKSYRRPRNFDTASDAMALVEFFEGPSLDSWCALTHWNEKERLKPCRIRKQLGL